ncbi:MAG: Hsp20/alpha crystallin family protein [Rhodothalassiaceae bacterium]
MLTYPVQRLGWDPISELARLNAQMERLFQPGQAAGLSPAVTLWLSEDRLVLTAELPGLSRDQISLTVEDARLRIEGERQRPEEAEADWLVRERDMGRFARTIDLPFRVDPEAVSARVVHGVLVVELKRSEADKPRRIAIQS